jgi:diguanylate cyclase (GGDEF)-like protein
MKSSMRRFNRIKERYNFSFYVLLSILGLVALLILGHMLFFRSQIEKAVYIAVINESKIQLQKQVSQTIRLLHEEEKEGEKFFKKELQREVSNAWAIANAIYLYGKSMHLSDFVIRELIKRALSKYSLLDGRGEIFVENTKGLIILNPKHPSTVGKDFWNWKDLKGNYVHREISSLALFGPDNEGFLTYYWYLPDTKNPNKKLVFVKLFKPYRWVIGGTIYEESIRKWVKEHIFSLSKSANLLLIEKDKLSQYPFLRNLTLEELKEGIFLKTNDKLYYLRYCPKWNWIVGSYITSNSLVQQVFFLKEKFLSKVSRAVKLISIGLFGLIVISIFGILKYYRELLEKIRQLTLKEFDILRMARKLRLAAYKDDITGLPNRKKFLKDLALLKEKGVKLHFALLNIRNFKDINELFGFEGGNEVLKKFALHLKRMIRKNRKSKNCQIKLYRIRGDKFGILGCNMTDAFFIEYIQDLIKKLERIEFNIDCKGQKVNFRLNLVAGISKNPDEFLIESEIAEELAKKNGVDVYMVDLEVEKIKQLLHRNIQIVTILKNSLDAETVVPYFQPIVNLKTNEIEKYDVLMRISYKYILKTAI